ncbi:MAG TPA: hypothetical protein VF252_01915 [Gemmatimonadales bacterium]
MTFKPKIWYPIAAALSALNLVAVGFAAGEPQPWHVATHAVLALAFGLWAQRLRSRPVGNELPGSAEVFDALDAVESEVARLRQDLNETQERLDFTERLLAQRAEQRQVGPQP